MKTKTKKKTGYARHKTTHEPFVSDHVNVGDVVEGFSFTPTHGQHRTLAGEWLVFETSFGGGGRSHNDVFPDYYRIKLINLNRNGTIPRHPKEHQIAVCAQQAPFVIDNVPNMKVVGHFDKIVNVKWKRVW